jgi:hypothetical protein
MIHLWHCHPGHILSAKTHALVLTEQIVWIWINVELKVGADKFKPTRKITKKLTLNF